MHRFNLFKRLDSSVYAFGETIRRLKEKIDNRIGNSDIGKRVINALLNKGIIYSKEIMYFVNTDRMASELGIKYNDIRSSTINDKIRQFLLNA